MRRIGVCISIAFLASTTLVAPAGAQHQQPAGQGHPARASSPGQHAYTEGEVRAVEKENRKITLKHGEIPNIDMPPMTMSFSVRDAKTLDTLKPGDKVKFRAINDAGNFTLTELIPLR